MMYTVKSIAVLALMPSCVLYFSIIRHRLLSRLYAMMSVLLTIELYVELQSLELHTHTEKFAANLPYTSVIFSLINYAYRWQIQ